ncbi:cupin, partial [Rhizobium leguminosarum]
MANFIPFGIDGVEPEFGAPEPGRIISGDPHFRTWNLEEAEGGLYSGIWE